MKKAPACAGALAGYRCLASDEAEDADGDEQVDQEQCPEVGSAGMVVIHVCSKTEKGLRRRAGDLLGLLLIETCYR